MGLWLRGCPPPPHQPAPQPCLHQGLQPPAVACGPSATLAYAGPHSSVCEVRSWWPHHARIIQALASHLPP